MEYTDTVYIRVYNIFPYMIRKLIRNYGNYPHGQVNSGVLLGGDRVYTILCRVHSLRVLLEEVIDGIKGTPPEGSISSNHSANTTTIVYNPEDVKPTHREISSKPSRQGSRR
jgi:hypothetical protein